MLGSAKLNLLVTSSPECPELKILEVLKDEVHTVAVGRSLAELSHLSDEEWKNIDVILNCGAHSTPRRAHSSIACLLQPLTELGLIKLLIMTGSCHREEPGLSERPCAM